MENRTTTQVWEERYRDNPVWSGNPNAALVAHVSELTGETSLDLGCGEGADAIWLAQRGWQATGVDVSPTALARAQQAAEERGVSPTWVEADLAHWEPEATYDLVTSFFLHSPVNFPRAQILRRAAKAVAPGGHLLVVGHAEFPPWSSHSQDGDHDHPTFPTVEETIDEAQVGEWEAIVTDLEPRLVTSPEGQQATIRDVVVLMQRPGE